MAGRLQFITRRNCHLCDDALRALSPIAATLGVALDVLDVDTDEGLAMYSDQVPVLRTGTGRVLHTGSLGRLRALWITARTRLA